MKKNRTLMRVTTFEDILYVAQNIRQADKEELWASSHMLPLAVLRAAYLTSRDVMYTGEIDDETICIFGVKQPSLLGDTACPWLLASNKLEFHSREFLIQSKKIVNVLRNIFPIMSNYVDARNTVAIRWLQWIGFSVYYPIPYGVERLPFHRFEMRAANV